MNSIRVLGLLFACNCCAIAQSPEADPFVEVPTTTNTLQPLSAEEKARMRDLFGSERLLSLMTGQKFDGGRSTKDERDLIEDSLTSSELKILLELVDKEHGMKGVSQRALNIVVRKSVEFDQLGIKYDRQEVIDRIVPELDLYNPDNPERRRTSPLIGLENIEGLYDKAIYRAMPPLLLSQDPKTRAIADRYIEGYKQADEFERGSARPRKARNGGKNGLEGLSNRKDIRRDSNANGKNGGKLESNVYWIMAAAVLLTLSIGWWVLQKMRRKSHHRSA